MKLFILFHFWLMLISRKCKAKFPSQSETEYDSTNYTYLVKSRRYTYKLQMISYQISCDLKIKPECPWLYMEIQIYGLQYCPHSLQQKTKNCSVFLWFELTGHILIPIKKYLCLVSYNNDSYFISLWLR